MILTQADPDCLAMAVSAREEDLEIEHFQVGAPAPLPIA